MDIRAVTFDCYGTLIDWDSGVGTFATGGASEAGIAIEAEEFLTVFSEAQRRHQAGHTFKPYREVLRDACVDTMQACGMGSDPAAATRFAASVGDWPPFPDTVAALRRFKERFVLGVVSNVDDESFAHTHHLLGGVMDEIVTADMVRSYKPAPPHFRTMLQRLAARGIAKDTVIHLAQSRFHDIGPAQELGIRSVLIDRPSDKPGHGLTIACVAEPDYRVEGLDAAVALVETLI